MAGADVQKYTVDSKASDAVLSLRSAFAKVEIMAKWLENQPNDPTNGDSLVTVFGFTADDAYLIRSVFQQLETIRTTNASLFDNARKLTGLE